MKKEEIIEWKKERINRLKRLIKSNQEEIQEYKKQIEILNDLVTKEEIREFEADFWKLSKDERTNTKISGMLNKINKDFKDFEEKN